MKQVQKRHYKVFLGAKRYPDLRHAKKQSELMEIVIEKVNGRKIIQKLITSCLEEESAKTKNC